LAQDNTAERAIIVYHADDLEDVDQGQAALNVGLDAVKAMARDRFKDIALESSWGDARAFIGHTGYAETVDSHEHEEARRAVGQIFDGPADGRNRDRVAFFENDSGQIERTARDDDDWGHELGDEYINREEGLRGERGFICRRYGDRNHNIFFGSCKTLGYSGRYCFRSAWPCHNG